LGLKVLVVGGGGREDALVWRLLRSASVGEVLCAPGNGGIARRCRTVAVAAEDVEGQLALALREQVGLVVVGPEAPLVAGLADRLRAAGIPTVGCSARAARLEGSKAFAKELMQRHGIPTAAFGVFDTVAAAQAFVESHGDRSWVVKADGLAQGKGVTICPDRAATLQEVARLLDGRALGAAGARVVVEEFLIGEEASLLALVHGTRVVPLAPAEDHKTVFDGDTGPMTGGMGTVSPTPVLSGALVDEAVRTLLVPTARALVAEGCPFEGILFAGLMVTADGPKVLEFNCRFGDPETQVLMARLDEDLGLLLSELAAGRLPETVRFTAEAAVCVVLTAPGYPGSYPTGAPLSGLEAALAQPGIELFFAGTRADGDRLVTSGGRVLGVTACAPTVAEARHRALAAVAEVRFPGAHHRTDIGARPRSVPL
jgi:phosphoribosylamine--glycine ligase